MRLASPQLARRSGANCSKGLIKMAKKTVTAVSEQVGETAVQSTEEPRNLIGVAIEHMSLAAKMLRSKGGKHAEACAYVAAELERRVGQLEKLNE